MVCPCVSDKEWSEWYNSDRPVYGQGVDDETLQRISLVSIVTIIYLTCDRQWVQVGLPFCLPVMLTRYVTGDSSSLPVCLPVCHYHHHHHHHYSAVAASMPACLSVIIIVNIIIIIIVVVVVVIISAAAVAASP